MILAMSGILRWEMGSGVCSQDRTDPRTHRPAQAFEQTLRVGDSLVLMSRRSEQLEAGVLGSELSCYGDLEMSCRTAKLNAG